VVLDLPGSYSLSPQSLDEQIARDVLLGQLRDVPPPALVVVIVDASNLERNLYYATQVIELGIPTLLALNMMDVARANGRRVDTEQLAQLIGVPVAPLVASTGEGIPALRAKIVETLRRPTERAVSAMFCELPALFHQEIAALAQQLGPTGAERHLQRQVDAMLLLSDERNLGPDELRQAISAARHRLEAAGIAWRRVVIEGRYARIAAIHKAVVAESAASQDTFSDRLDRIVTHKTWGLLIFLAIMAVMFQSIFGLARLPMEALEHGVTRVGQFVGQLIPPGDLHSLVEDGIIAGVGAVLVFLPQICLLFLGIGLLEDTGYMARAAFLMDRFMSKVGLHGKSFIPMLSSFACAIPGIMATRTIESQKDRLATMLICPLMSCSARLPVYTLLIAACIPDRLVLAFVGLPGLTLFAMYLLGTTAGLFMAWLFKKTMLKGNPPLLIMELPPYKRPLLTVMLRHMWDRTRVFLRQAGTIILGFNILLWFLATYPHNAELKAKYTAEYQAALASQSDGSLSIKEIDQAKASRLAEIRRRAASDQLQHSYAGRLGKLIEPLIAPLGFDWKIGIGIVASFAAREIFVSTMSTVYSVGKAGETSAMGQGLAQTMRAQKRPDGSPLYTPLTGLSLMVFYVFALQCVSTVAVMRRETNSWRWPLFQWAYLGLLGWIFAFLTFQGGRLIGWQ
jgi:ferrous iron transport protein B